MYACVLLPFGSGPQQWLHKQLQALVLRHPQVLVLRLEQLGQQVSISFLFLLYGGKSKRSFILFSFTWFMICVRTFHSHKFTFTFSPFPDTDDGQEQQVPLERQLGLLPKLEWLQLLLVLLKPVSISSIIFDSYHRLATAISQKPPCV